MREQNLDRNQSSEDYYRDLKKILFNENIECDQQSRFRGSPKIKFIINREMNVFTGEFIFDFLVDLYSLYGEKFEIVSVGKGCITLVTSVSMNATLRNDFRKVMWSDTEMHAVFAEYNVSRIYPYCFPKIGGIPDNLDNPRFRINKLGKPSPF